MTSNEPGNVEISACVTRESLGAILSQPCVREGRFLILGADGEPDSTRELAFISDEPLSAGRDIDIGRYFRMLEEVSRDIVLTYEHHAGAGNITLRMPEPIVFVTPDVSEIVRSREIVVRWLGGEEADRLNGGLHMDCGESGRDVQVLGVRDEGEFRLAVNPFVTGEPCRVRFWLQRFRRATLHLGALANNPDFYYRGSATAFQATATLEFDVAP